MDMTSSNTVGIKKSSGLGGVTPTKPKQQASQTIKVANQSTNDWKQRLNSAVEMFNKEHANVIINGKHKIMRTTDDGFEFISLRDFIPLYANKLIQTGVKQKGDEEVPTFTNLAEAWLKHHKSRVYRKGVVFKPLPIGARALDNDYFNLWQGFTVTPNKGSWSLLYEHIKQVVCNNDKELMEYLLNWIAYKLQNPDKQGQVAMILRGKKGSGKGTLGHFLMSLYGKHGLHISNTKHLIGHFNGHLADTCFLFADEAFFSGDKKHEGVLKALITENKITIERKGVDAYQSNNFLQVLMATNEEWAVPASADERRYCVCDVSDKYIKNNEYFTRLHQHIELQETKEAFLYDMLNRDLSQWYIGNIPETKGLKDQRIMSLNSIGNWLVDAITRGYFEDVDIQGQEGKWVAVIPANKLAKSYHTYCNNYRVNQYDMKSETLFGKELVKIFRRVRTKDGKLYNVGNLEEARQTIQQYYKIDLDQD